MPIYVWYCRKCGKRFENIQKLQDPPPKCISCESEDVHKLMGKSTFKLKGEGWYQPGMPKAK